MDPDISRDTLLKKLNGEWLKNIENDLSSQLGKEAQQLKKLLEVTLERLKKGESEKAFNDLLKKIKPSEENEEEENDGEEEKSSEAKSEIEWLESVNKITDDLPENAELVQEEERFIGKQEDPFLVRSHKFLKRAWRGYVSGLAKLFASGEKDSFQVWKQTVRVQSIVKFHFLDLGDWVKSWDNEFRRVECNILLEVEAKVLHSNDLFQMIREKKDEEGEEDKQSLKVDDHKIPVPNDEDIEIFFEKAIEEVENILNDHKRSLKEIVSEKKDQITNAFSIAGTVEMSGNDFSAANINRKENQHKQNHESRAENWRELKIALANKLTLSKEFVKVYEQVKERIAGFSDTIAEFFKEGISDPISELSAMLEETIQLFEEKEDESEKATDAPENRNEKGAQIQEFIESKLIKPIGEFTEGAELSTKLDRFTSAIQEWTNGLPDKAVLVEKLDLAEFPPKFEFEEVEWKSLVKRVLNNQIANQFVPKEIKPEEFLARVSDEVNEIQQIIITNLEISGEVKKTDDEDPIEVAKEGLIRARSKLKDLADSVSGRKNELIQKLNDQRNKAFTKLANLLDKQDVSDVLLAGAHYKAKETAVDWKSKVQAIWARFVDKLELLYRFCHKKINFYVVTVRDFLGFAQKVDLESTKVDLATFLSETDEKISKLPFIYRRLFDFQKEVDSRFYIRRTSQFENFKRGYELWQNNFPSSFAVVGEKGSGKSLFINMVEDEIIKKHDIIEIKFEGTIADKHKIIEQIATALKISDVKETKDLIEAIRRKKKRVVVILENIQDCYIRSISGFEGIEELLYLISETNKEILWMVSCTRYGWLFLDKVLNISNYFTHAAESDNLSADQIQDLILRRHNASGYDLKFLPDESSKKSRAFKKHMDDEEKTQEYLCNTYFEKLSRLSEGNPSTAMIYWIRSIKDYDDTHFYINPFNFSSIDRIENLDSSDLFALTAFVLHDSLYPEDLSKIIHQPRSESRLIVSRLATSSILVESKEGYILNHLIYRQIIRVLKEANFIH
ncbi:MAG: hypothetical protein U5K71_12310 [Gracilimonas sp.]|nr:hypothetical protein [Gracilimonas sp.]